MVLPKAFMMVRRVGFKTVLSNRKISIMGKGEVEQCENAQHPDNQGKWFARPDHFAKTLLFLETILQFCFFCKISQNNQQDFLKKSAKKRGIEGHWKGQERGCQRGNRTTNGKGKRKE